MDLAEQICKTVNDLTETINSSDLIIIVKDRKTIVIEKGKRIEGIQHIDFTHSFDELPSLIIEKLLIGGDK